MKKFKCINRCYETGINWYSEARTYSLQPTFFSKFTKPSIKIKISSFGEFYFNPDNKKSLPKEGNKNNGYMLKSFKGKKIFKWLEENITNRIDIHCRRDYSYGSLSSSYDIDTYIITVKFTTNEDAVAFKLWWF